MRAKIQMGRLIFRLADMWRLWICRLWGHADGAGCCPRCGACAFTLPSPQLRIRDRIRAVFLRLRREKPPF